MKGILKTIPFIILLMAASGYLGNIFQKVFYKGASLFDISLDNLYFIIWTLLAIALILITAALAAVLVRPFWLGIVAYALSSIVLFLMWGRPGLESGIGSLIYLVALTIFDKQVNGELDKRITFSIRAISESKSLLVFLLIVLFCASFYFGYAEKAKAEGFKVPGFITQISVKMAEGMIGEEEIRPEEKERFMAEIKEQIETQLQSSLGQYQRFISLGMAWIILSVLEMLAGILFWIPVLILSLIFYILSSLHITKLVTETKEVAKLTLS